ncbi:MAG TPA: hypothetical protein ENL34_11290 [Chloroflexi bacterium]|nr:hypothetical protein [Chloroflexota bacterium]
MELRGILGMVRQWWWLGLIPVLVVVAMLAFTYTPPPQTYQVVLRFATGGTPPPTLSPDYDRYYAWLSSEYIANGLADLATTSAFASAVATRLTSEGLNITADALQAAIATDNAQSMLVVYITWSDADQVVRIARAVGDTLLELGPTYYPQMMGIGTVARWADQITANPVAPSLRNRLLAPAVRLGLAVAIGAALILTAHYLDAYVRDPQTLTQQGLPVLGAIPRQRKWMSFRRE